MQEMNYEVGDSVGKAFATIQHEEEVLKKKWFLVVIIDSEKAPAMLIHKSDWGWHVFDIRNSVMFV
jgi:hypothetical protein